WRGRVYAVRYFLTFLAAGAAVTAIALLYGRGGFDLVLGTTATIALGFVFATAAIAVLGNGVEKQRSRVVAPAAEPLKKSPGLHPGLCSGVETAERSEVHPAAHSARARRHGRRLLLRHLGDHRLGGDEQASHGSRVLQCGAHHLGRIDNAFRHQIAVVAGLGVEAEAVLIVLHVLA